MSVYESTNEAIEVWSTTVLPVESKIAVATFCRQNGYPHLFVEAIEPLLDAQRLVLTLATTERPWPRGGVGSQRVHALAISMLASENKGLLTPVLLDLRQSTNLGLAAAVIKASIDDLVAREVDKVTYLVRVGDRALERAIEQVGFQRADLVAATEFGEYVEFATPPDALLDALGLGSARRGSVLSLAVDGQALDRLSQFHFVLSAGMAPYLADSHRYAFVLPGLVDLVATLPPGGVPPGTPGPKRLIEELIGDLAEQLDDQ